VEQGSEAVMCFSGTATYSYWPVVVVSFEAQEPPYRGAWEWRESMTHFTLLLKAMLGRN